MSILFRRFVVFIPPSINIDPESLLAEIYFLYAAGWPIIMSVNFDKVCRSCTNEAKRMHPLFKAVVGDRLANILNAFTTIAVRNTSLFPKTS